MNDTITAVPGLRVGHAHDTEALTGCTVILCESGAVGGVDQRGGAPGTRETDLLRPLHMVEKVHAVLLAGGSAFGLDAATGVMRYLEEGGFGYDTAVARVPIVPAAILFDLALGRPDVRPDAAMGYQACLNASAESVVEGCVGAGMGATVGKMMGMSLAVKSGVGSASLSLPNGLVVGALAVVNALGDVVDPGTGRILAGTRSPDPAAGPFADAMAVLHMLAARPPLGSNTTIGVVATNALLTKEQANWVAQMAQDGLARAIRPAHTLYDGDTIFALSTGDLGVDFNVVGALAAEVFAQAVVRAVQAAEPAGGLPSIRNMAG
jgi:L-aminopeptidase/D-esterase-like protein